MIAALVRMLARTLIELGLVLLVAGGLFLFLAFRFIRRLTVGGEDVLEQYSSPLMKIAGAVAELAAITRART